MNSSSFENNTSLFGSDSSKIDIENNSDENKKKIVVIDDTDQELLLALADQKPTFLVILLTIVASISGFLFGYDTGYISTALVAVGDDLGQTLSYGQKELITSATSLGALIGAIFAGFSADVFGRKPVIMASDVLFIIGSAMQTGASSVSVMIAGRLIMGFGVGIGSLCAPLFISELAPAKFRGRLVIVQCATITGGGFIAYAIGAGLVHIKHGWRILVGLAMLPPLIQFVFFFFLPDTPRYYIMKNKPDLAKNVFKRTYTGVSDDLLQMKVDELARGDKAIPGNNPFTRTWAAVKKIHQTPSYFRALLIASGLQAIQQFSSFNALMYFSATIFETVGFENSTAVSIVVAGTNFIFTLVAFFVIDKVVRRKMLLITLPVMVISLAVCCVAFHFTDIKFGDDGTVSSGGTGGMSNWGIVIIVTLIVFVAFYASGIGTVAWLQSELFPQDVRGVGCSYSTAVNWSGSLICASTFLTMMKNITPTGTFGFFLGLMVVAFILVYFCYPELSGLELEETQKFLAGGFNIKDSLKLYKERKHKAVTMEDVRNHQPAKKGPEALHVEHA